MNWSSVKNLLILMLLAANMFLVYSILTQDRHRSYIDESELYDAAAILEERGLSVNISGIPLRRFDSDIYGSNYPAQDDYYESVARALSDSERDQVHMLLDGGVRINSKNGASTEFKKDFGFSYISDGNASQSAYTEITADNFDEFSAGMSELGLARFASLSRIAEDFLSLGVSDESRLKAHAESGVYDEDSGLAYITLSQELEEIPIFRHRAVCVFDGERIISASGRWYFAAIDTSYSFDCADQVNILFTDLDTLAARVDPIEGEATLPAVDAMSACYAIYMNAEKTALYFIPAWQIEHSDGSVIVYNAAQSTQYFVS